MVPNILQNSLNQVFLLPQGFTPHCVRLLLIIPLPFFLHLSPTPILGIFVRPSAPGGIPQTISSHLAPYDVYLWLLFLSQYQPQCWAQTVARSLRICLHDDSCCGLLCVAFKLVTLWGSVPTQQRVSSQMAGAQGLFRLYAEALH